MRTATRRRRAASYGELRQRHVADHQPLFRRVTLDLGPSAAGASAHRPAAGTRARRPGRSRVGRAVLPVWALPAHRRLARRLAAAARTCRASGTTTSPATWAGPAISTSTSTRSRTTGPPKCAICPSATNRSSASSSRCATRGGARRRPSTERAAGSATSSRIPGATPRRAGDWAGACTRPAASGSPRTCGNDYLFTGDREFLRQRAYPTLKEAAEFFLDYMVEDPRARLAGDGALHLAGKRVRHAQRPGALQRIHGTDLRHRPGPRPVRVLRHSQSDARRGRRRSAASWRRRWRSCRRCGSASTGS